MGNWAQLYALEDEAPLAQTNERRPVRMNRSFKYGMAIGWFALYIPADIHHVSLLPDDPLDLMKRLTRSGHLHVEEEGWGYLSELLGEGSADPGLSTLQWASCRYRIAFGPNAGRSILQRQDASRVADTVKPRCVSPHGFSLHAGIRCWADQRRELERLCCYITRPALSHERVAPSARRIQRKGTQSSCSERQAIGVSAQVGLWTGAAVQAGCGPRILAPG